MHRANFQGHSSEHPDDGFIDVEFRQGSAVVAWGSVSTGMALTVEAPLGATQIYSDGVEVGAVDEGVATDGPVPSAGCGHVCEERRGLPGQRAAVTRRVAAEPLTDTRRTE